MSGDPVQTGRCGEGEQGRPRQGETETERAKGYDRGQVRDRRAVKNRLADGRQE